MQELARVLTDDPLGIFLAVAMFFVLMFWLSQTNTAINVIGGNTTITGKYTSAYANTSWLLWIVFSPFALLLIGNWALHRSSDSESVVREEGEEEE